MSMSRTALMTALLAPLMMGCNGDPTTARVANGYPVADGGQPMTVRKVWWLTTLFGAPVAAGQQSETERAIPGDAVAYALLAPGWAPTDAEPPLSLIALRSKQPVTAAAHDLLTIEVNDELFTGNCAAGQSLSDEEAGLIVESIFPGDFAGWRYDAATCTRR